MCTSGHGVVFDAVSLAAPTRHVRLDIFAMHIRRRRRGVALRRIVMRFTQDPSKAGYHQWHDFIY
jgi:hypothetical protein